MVYLMSSVDRELVKSFGRSYRRGNGNIIGNRFISKPVKYLFRQTTKLCRRILWLFILSFNICDFHLYRELFDELGGGGTSLEKVEKH